MTTTEAATATQVYQLYIKASQEQVWDAITNPEIVAKFFHGAGLPGRGVHDPAAEGLHNSIANRPAIAKDHRGIGDQLCRCIGDIDVVFPGNMRFIDIGTHFLDEGVVVNVDLSVGGVTEHI